MQGPSEMPPTLADRVAAGDVDEREFDPHWREPEEDDPPDELDPGLRAELAAERENWLRAPEAADLSWLDSSPPTPGTAGTDLVNAARDAVIDDDLARLTDAELIGQARASRDLAARAQGRMYRTFGELLRRRPARSPRNRRADARQRGRIEEENPDPDPGALYSQRVPAMASAEAAAEIALALTLTGYGAEKLTEITSDLQRRLPRALQEMEAGRLDNDKAKIIWEYSRDLCGADAVKFDAALSPKAPAMTTGELRDRARREQIRIDPDAADKRRQRNEKNARLDLYANDDHTGTLAFCNIPAELAAAAKARVNAIARAAKNAGAKEKLSLLEAKTGLGLLLGTLPVIPPPVPPGDSAGPDDPGGGPPDPGDPDPEPGNASPPPEPEDEWPDGEPADSTRPGDWRGGDRGGELPASEPRGGESMPWPILPDTSAQAAPGCAVIPPGLRPKNPGRIRLQAPWRSLAGIAGEPGDLSWFGAVTPGQARDLASAAAADPACNWRVIVTDEDGHAIALTTLGRRARTDGLAPGLVDEVTITIQATLAAALDSDDEMRAVARNLVTGLDPRLSGKLLDVIAAASKAAAGAEFQAILDAEAGGCAHSTEVPGYRVPDTMRRWLCTRDFTCRNPICRRRGTQCDMDHTLAYDEGGRTCPCGLGPLCRGCHQLKQGYGWHLEQDPRTGVFTWTTPAGLTYRKGPHQYPV